MDFVGSSSGKKPVFQQGLRPRSSPEIRELTGQSPEAPLESQEIPQLAASRQVMHADSVEKSHRVPIGSLHQGNDRVLQRSPIHRLIREISGSSEQALPQAQYLPETVGIDTPSIGEIEYGRRTELHRLSPSTFTATSSRVHEELDPQRQNISFHNYYPMYPSFHHFDISRSPFQSFVQPFSSPPLNSQLQQNLNIGRVDMERVHHFSESGRSVKLQALQNLHQTEPELREPLFEPHSEAANSHFQAAMQSHQHGAMGIGQHVVANANSGLQGDLQSRYQAAPEVRQQFSEAADSDFLAAMHSHHHTAMGFGQYNAATEDSELRDDLQSRYHAEPALGQQFSETSDSGLQAALQNHDHAEMGLGQYFSAATDSELQDDLQSQYHIEPSLGQHFLEVADGELPAVLQRHDHATIEIGPNFSAATDSELRDDLQSRNHVQAELEHQLREAVEVGSHEATQSHHHSSMVLGQYFAVASGSGLQDDLQIRHHAEMGLGRQSSEASGSVLQEVLHSRQNTEMRQYFTAATDAELQGVLKNRYEDDMALGEQLSAGKDLEVPVVLRNHHHAEMATEDSAQEVVHGGPEKSPHMPDDHASADVSKSHDQSETRPGSSSARSDISPMLQDDINVNEKKRKRIIQSFDYKDYAAWAERFAQERPSSMCSHDLNGKIVGGKTLDVNYRAWLRLPIDQRTPDGFVAFKRQQQLQQQTYDTNDYKAWAEFFADTKPSSYKWYEVNDKTVSGKTLSENYVLWNELPKDDQTPAGFAAHKLIKQNKPKVINCYDAEDFVAWAKMFVDGKPNSHKLYNVNGKSVRGRTLVDNYRMWENLPKDKQTPHEFSVFKQTQKSHRYDTDDFLAWAEFFSNEQPNTYATYNLNGKTVSGITLYDNHRAWLKLDESDRTPQGFLAHKMKKYLRYKIDDFCVWADFFKDQKPSPSCTYTLNGKAVNGKLLYANYSLWLNLPENERNRDGFIALKKRKKNIDT